METETKDNKAPVQHKTPSYDAATPAGTYVNECFKMRTRDNPKSFVNGGLLRFMGWVGEAALSVPPQNRFWCATGLCVGLFSASKVGTVLAGRDYFGNEVKKPEKGLLKFFHGKLAFEPLGTDFKNRWLKLAQYGIFAAGGAIGVLGGTRIAYKKAYERNKNPEFLENYIGRVSQHQGDKWSMLSAFSGVFGSSSGYSMVPIPGINYGMSIAGRTILMQDRRVMMPGLGKVLSNSSTNDYMSLREGQNYLIKYAVLNPEKDPHELEHLALMMLGPLFPDLRADHIAKFVGQVHDVRDKYWEKGGIPADKRKEALKDMEAHFKGAGFEETLEKAGLDPMDIDFTRINGALGKIGNVMGAKHQILKEQEEYRAKLIKRREARAAQQEEKEEKNEAPAPQLQPPQLQPRERAPDMQAEAEDAVPESKFARDGLRSKSPRLAGLDSAAATHQERVADSGKGIALRA